MIDSIRKPISAGIIMLILIQFFKEFNPFLLDAIDSVEGVQLVWVLFVLDAFWAQEQILKILIALDQYFVHLLLEKVPLFVVFAVKGNEITIETIRTFFSLF